MLISWIFAVILVVILGVSIAFALRVFHNSGKGELAANEDLKEINLFSIMSKKNKKEAAREMQLKITELEDACENYSSQFKRLNHRIELLENGSLQPKKETDEADWEEFYKQEKIERENIKLELADTTDALHYAEEKLLLNEDNSRLLSELESRIERQLNELHILQNKIEELQRNLEGAQNREKELMEQLDIAKAIEQEFTSLQKNYTSLISENDGLHQRVSELSNNEISLEQAKQKLSEMESLLDAHDYEKVEIKSTVDNILSENTALSNKLKDLLEKFSEEKYAE
ncbi:MAG: hypothetical protein WKF91_23325 [Segetibacter sp.]